MIARIPLIASSIAATALLCPIVGLASPDSITAARLREHVIYLADDARGGRDTGSTGCAEAEAYIATEFSEFGLAFPPNSDDFYLAYNLYRSGYDVVNSRLVIGPTVGRIGVDFRPFNFSAEGDVAHKVVFAGYGITAPEYNYDDYEDLEVTDSIVVVLRREPGADDSTSVFDGVENTDHATFRRKAETAQANGARAILIVTDPTHPSVTDDLRANGRLRITEDDPDPSTDDEDAADGIVAVQISRKIGYALIESVTGMSAADAQRRLDRGDIRLTEIEPRNVFARIAVSELDKPELVHTRNVVGVLEGSDPELNHEFIVLGAHHDHVGAFTGTGDTVFNGADDNASGTAAIIELARAFAANAVPPRRSIIFATFSGEERGLLGSTVMVDDKQISIDDTVFMLNIDMIGRNSDVPLDISGDGVARGLHDLVESANRGLGLDLNYLGKAVARNTDHTPFYDAGIPFITFFSGFHDDYHQVGDHADKLDYPRMETAVRLAYEIARSVANLDVAPGMIHSVSWLGLAFEEVDGPVVTSVEGGSRAAKAGIRLDDRLAKVGGKRVSTAREANDAMRGVEPGTSTTLSMRQTDGSLVTFDVTRARRGYLGINPGAITDEQRQEIGLTNDEGILVRGVVSGGPSEAGGVREGDILMSLGGQPVTTGRLFSLLAQIGAGETIDVRLIRGGKYLDRSVTLGERGRR